MYGFRFHDATNHEPIEKTFETCRECLQEINKLNPRDYPSPIGIDFVEDDEEGFIKVITPNFYSRYLEDAYKKVKTLIEELKKFDENYYVKLSGGNGAYGDWATLTVCEDEEDAMWDIGTVIMEESD